jgi:mono/diheme cytochrome c family protein
VGKRLLFLSILVVLLSACNLAGDITPPPGVATAAALRPTVDAAASPRPTSVPVSLQPPETHANLQNGEMIYLEKCLPCHGAEGGGDGPQAANLPEGILPSALGDPGVAYSSTPMEWYSIVTRGNIESFMPGFSSLSETDRWDVVAYAFRLSSTLEDLQNGAEIYEQHCSQCHGGNGEGTDTGSVLTDPVKFVDRTVDEILTVIRDGTDGQMPSFADELSEDELGSVSAYLMNLSLAGGESETAEEVVTVPDGQVSAVVRGQVFNGTAGAGIPEDTSVTLHGFDEQSEVILDSSDVDETGAFSFGELELQPGWVFVATIEHQGVLYGSEIVDYAGEAEVFLPLTFFETSDDLEAVSVDRLHIILNLISEGVLEVTQVWIISNPTDYTISSPDGSGIVEIALPQGATSLQFESDEFGDRFVSTENGFVDTLPMQPGLGTHELVFSFLIAFEDGMEYRQPIGYPIDAVVIITSASGLAVEGEGIIDQGQSQMGTSVIRTYAGGRIEAGSEVAITIMTAEVEGVDAQDGSLLNVGIGVVSVLAAAAAVGIWWFRRGIPSPDEPSVEGDFHSPGRSEGQHQEELLRSIANLDDAFEAGELDEGAYQAGRSDLMSKLIDLMQAAEHD